MPLNLTKRYNQHLDLLHYHNDHSRINALKLIFNRDITNNSNFQFRSKIIRPLKVEGIINMEVLFKHLTHLSEYIFENGETKHKKRDIFDLERSKRLHWIWHHIQEKTTKNIECFSYKDRINGKYKIRTYIYDFVEQYIIILEPQRSGQDYYLISAYFLTEKLGGRRSIEVKRKAKLPDLY